MAYDWPTYKHDLHYRKTALALPASEYASGRRPPQFQLDESHSLYNGLHLALLGYQDHASPQAFIDSSPYRNDAGRVGTELSTFTEWSSELQRHAIKFSSGSSTSRLRVRLRPGDDQTGQSDFTNFSFSVWVDPDGVSVDRGILYHGEHVSGSSFAFWFDQSSPDQWAYIITDSASHSSGVDYSAESASAGLAHLCLTFEPTVSRLFINGVEDANSPFAGMSLVDDIGYDWTNASGYWHIGGDAPDSSTKRFNGIMADPMIWLRTLDESEVKILASKDPMYGGFVQPLDGPLPYFTRRTVPSRRRTYIPLPVGGE